MEAGAEERTGFLCLLSVLLVFSQQRSLTLAEAKDSVSFQPHHATPLPRCKLPSRNMHSTQLLCPKGTQDLSISYLVER